MKRLEKKILKSVKTRDVTSWEDIALQLNRTLASLRKAKRALYKEGYICNYHGGRIGVFYRSIDVYKKGYDKVISENYYVHGVMTSRAEVLVAEIELPNQITISQLRKAIKCSENDYYYDFNYEINENNAILFERTNNIKFDFENFEYILG